MTPITLLLAAVLPFAAQVGDLTDSDLVVTGATDRIETSGLPGPKPGTTVTRTVNADLTVTDDAVPPYWVDEIPIVSTNYDVTRIPITETITTVFRAPDTVTVTDSSGTRQMGVEWANTGTAEWGTTSSPILPTGAVGFFGVYYLNRGATVNPYFIVKTSSGTYNRGVNHNYNRLPGTAEKGDALRAMVESAAKEGTGTIDLSSTPDDSGTTVNCQIKFGAEPSTHAKFIEFTTLVTNGWTVVTNGYTVVTNGFDYVTNDIPRLVRHLVTDDVPVGGMSSDVPTGTSRGILTNSEAGVILGASVDPMALQPRVSIGDGSVLHIPSLQTVLVGGSVTNGRVVGGKTVYGYLETRVGDAVREGISYRRDLPVTTDTERAGTLTVPGGEYGIEFPRYALAGSAGIRLDTALEKQILIPDRTRFRMYVRYGDETEWTYGGTLTCTEVEVKPDGFTPAAAIWSISVDDVEDGVTFPVSHREHPSPGSSEYTDVFPSTKQDLLADPYARYNDFRIEYYDAENSVSPVVPYGTNMWWAPAAGSYMAEGVAIFRRHEFTGGEAILEFGARCPGGFRFEREYDAGSYTNRGQVITKREFEDGTVPVSLIRDAFDARRSVDYAGWLSRVIPVSVTNDVGWKISDSQQSGAWYDTYAGPVSSALLDGLDSWAGSTPMANAYVMLRRISEPEGWVISTAYYEADLTSFDTQNWFGCVTSLVSHASASITFPAIQTSSSASSKHTYTFTRVPLSSVSGTTHVNPIVVTRDSVVRSRVISEGDGVYMDVVTEIER